MGTFVEKLFNASKKNKSLVCVGLDPDPSRMPVRDVFEFNKAIVDATKDSVCAFKPNLPFYEALGIPGLEALEKTVAHIRDVAPDVVLLGDGKRGDIASTNVYYARSLFEAWGFDAATVNVFAGGDSLQPFLDYQDKGVFVWCRSSNPGAADFQDLPVISNNGSLPVYQMVAKRAPSWNANRNVGLVMGATYPEELKSVRDLCPGIPFLVPGVGAQGGDLESSLRYGLDAEYPNLLVASSRGVLYASEDPKKFESAAHESAEELRTTINRIISHEGLSWF